MIRILVEGISQTRAGIGNMLMAIYGNIDKAKVQFDFIITEKSIYQEEIEALGGKCFVLPRWTNHPFEFNKSFKEIMAKGNYDFFWLHTSSKINTKRFKWIKKNTNASIIVHVHGTKNEYTGIKACLYPILEKLSENTLYKYIDHPFACSKLAVDFYYNPKKLGDKKPIIINNTIDIKKFAFNEEIRNKTRQELSLTENKVLLMAGRLVGIKNIPFALDVLEEIIKRDSAFKLVLAGSGPEKENIEALAMNKGIKENLLFVGARSDMENIYNAADALLMTSFAEGFPVAIIEAQASGLLCCISNTITKEVSICEDNNYYLDFDIKKWADNILENIERNRKEKSIINCEKLIKNGYDSKTYHKAFLELISQLK